jgi:uncharacterized glyoxalase superfamily protein PhnB
MRAPTYLDVAVPDVTAAVRFYRRAFSPETVLDGPNGSVEIWLVAEGVLSLRVLDEKSHAPEMREHVSYEKGKTPRLEIVAEDVDARVDALVKLGATVRTRLVRGKDGKPRERAEGDEPTGYAHVVDPFGHLWAIASADEEDEPE